MKLIKFIVKAVIWLTIITSTIFCISYFGFDYINPEKLKDIIYAYSISIEPNFYEACKAENSIALFYNGKISIIDGKTIHSYKVEEGRYKVLWSENWAVAFMKGSKFLYIIKDKKPFKIVWANAIQDVKINKQAVAVILKSSNQSFVSIYDTHLKNILNTVLNEYVVDVDYSNAKIVMLLKQEKNSETVYIAFADKRGIYKSKYIQEDYKKIYMIDEKVACIDNKGFYILNEDLQKSKIFKTNGLMYTIEGEREIFINPQGRAIVYNSLISNFKTKNIGQFLNISISQDKVLVLKEDRIFIYSKSLNILNEKGIDNINIKKAILINRHIFCIYPDKIVIYEIKFK